jgi:hypothetical protein
VVGRMWVVGRGQLKGLKKKTPNAHVHLQSPFKKHPPTSFFFFSLACFFLFSRHFSARSEMQLLKTQEPRTEVYS